MQDEGIKRENKTVATCGEGDPHQAQRQPVSIYLPQTVLEEYRADQKESRRRDTFRKRLEIGALLVAAFYAVVTYRLWRTAIDTERAAQRPYVSLGREDGTIAEIIGQSASQPEDTDIRLWFRNTGRQTAHDFTTNLCTMADVWANKCGPSHHVRPLNSPDMIGGIPIHNTWLGVDVGSDTYRDAIVGVKTSDLEQTRALPLPFFYDPKRSRGVPVQIVGTIEYTDSFDEYCCKEICVLFMGAVLNSFDTCWDPTRSSIVALLPFPRCPTTPTTCD
jgi:hypothetical protein